MAFEGHRVFVAKLETLALVAPVATRASKVHAVFLDRLACVAFQVSLASRALLVLSVYEVNVGCPASVGFSVLQVPRVPTE